MYYEENGYLLNQEGNKQEINAWLLQIVNSGKVIHYLIVTPHIFSS